MNDVCALIGGASTDAWFKVAVAISVHTGARLGEVAPLRWRHIGEQTVTLALSWEGPLVLVARSDEEGPRVMPLSPELAEILAAWRKVTDGGPDDHIVLVNARSPLKHRDIGTTAIYMRPDSERAAMDPRASVE